MENVCFLIFIKKFRFYHAVIPPSTTIFAPVIKLDASEQRSRSAPESSSALPVRFIIVLSESLPMNSILLCGVMFGNGPGVRLFTRILRLARAEAQYLVN